VRNVFYLPIFLTPKKGNCLKFLKQKLASFNYLFYLCPGNMMIMNKKSVLERLSTLKMPLMAVGVSQLGLFGSTVRGENTRKSDIDILIDFSEGQETYFNFLTACNILQDAFGKIKLDVVTKKGLSPYIGETILNEVEYV
jgi:predicted nucleotidyltransferase